MSRPLKIEKFTQPCVEGLALVLVFCVGCIPTLHPITTSETRVTRDALAGRWQATEGNARWEFSAAGEAGYELRFTEEGGKSGTFAAELTEIEGVLFLDLSPSREDSGKPRFYETYVISAHTFFRAEFLDGDQKLRLRSMKPEWVDRAIETKPETIPHTRIKTTGLLTAETAELRQFITEALGDADAWVEAAVLVRD